MSQRQFEDQTIFTVTKILYDEFKADQQQNRLDENQIKAYKRAHITPLYPHQTTTQKDGSTKISKFSVGRICCQLTPGYFCCGNTTKPDKVYRELGLGMCMYFKFIKHLIILFLLISILSAVSIFFYYLVASNNQIGIFGGYQDFLFSGTIGVLSSQRLKCNYLEAATATPINFNLNCPVGTVQLLGPVFTEKSLSDIKNCKKENDKWFTNDSSYSISSYTNTSTCNPENTQCNVSLTINQAVKLNRVAYNFQCRYAKYGIFSIQIPKQIVVYVSIGIDLFIAIAILWFIYSQKRAQDQQIQDFKATQLSVKDFAVQITGFTRQHIEQQFDQLANWMQNNIQKGFLKKIVKTKVPDDPSYISYQKNRRNKYQLLQQLMQKWFFEQLVDPNDYNTSSQFIQRHFGTLQHYNLYKQQLMKFIGEFKGSRIAQLQNQDQQTSIYMVLQSIKQKRRFKAYALDQCCSTNIIVGKRVHSIKQPPFPDLILWQNKDKYTKIRVLFSWILTIAIILGSYLLIGLVQFQKEKLIANYNFDVQCTLLFNSTSLQTYNNSLASNTYTHCYCSQHIVDLLTTTDITLQSLCQQWQRQYFIYILTPLLMSLILVIYNMIVSFIFRFLTDFQSLTLMNDHLFSYTIKRSVLLIMNMGLIIILITINYRSQNVLTNSVQFLFSGTYNDITSDWYLKIGTIVILTMILNIMFPLLMLIMKTVLKWIKMLWDKRCFTRITSKKTKKQYFNLYSGQYFPIQERYAEIIAVVFITLTFNCVMPMLNIIAFLSFFFMFISDKILIFRVYKKPPNYDHKMQKKMVRILFIAVVIHMVTSAFLISQPNLVLQGSTFQLATVLDSSVSRINTLFQTTYILPYVVIFALLIIFIFLKTTIFNFCSWLSQRCIKDNTKVIKAKLNANFYQVLTHYQINQLILAGQNQKNQFASNRHRTRLSINLTTQSSLIGFNEKKERPHARQVITNQLLKKLKVRYNHPSAHTGQVRLIGMPGYQRSLKGDYLNVERKIIYLDQLFKRLLTIDKLGIAQSS